MTEESAKIVKEECNSDLIFIPAGCTSLVQPMDLSVNRPFKSRNSGWSGFMKRQLDKGIRSSQLTKMFKLGIKNVPEVVIRQSFTLCGITATIDGSN